MSSTGSTIIDFNSVNISYTTAEECSVITVSIQSMNFVFRIQQAQGTKNGRFRTSY